MVKEREAPLKSMLSETRSFQPPAALQPTAHIPNQAAYERLTAEAHADYEGYWARQARAQVSWYQPFTTVLRQKEGDHVTWFEEGTLNACYNCVDRHLPQRTHKPAILWEGEPGDTRVLTYQDLHDEVVSFARVLQGLGIGRGDVVTLYLPMIPELAISMLACARLGAIHNVVFAGFSAEALASRNADAKAKLVVTADGGFRRGKSLPLKHTVDQSLELAATEARPLPAVVVVVKRCGEPVDWQAGRDHWWHELKERYASAPARSAPEALALPAEHPLFLLYTSGSTGKPKGLVHTTGGYLVGTALTSQLIFDLQEDDVYWCTADIGWITGHSYIVYGPLAKGATILMYEGAPDTPDWGRFWQLIAKYRVSKFYTAPTAIRSFMRYGPTAPAAYDLSSLKILGSVGEPINPEAWLWYYEAIGQGRCPIVDTWWQTETGAVMISPLPAASTTKPGSACRAFPGIAAAVVDGNGEAQAPGDGGYLVIKKPWPSMARTILGDHARYREQYWQKIPGVYFTGDGARCDADGDFWIMGRIDDVINCAGHRLSTTEIESALVSHPQVTEAAVIGKADPLKGEVVVAFVTLAAGGLGDDALKVNLSQHVVTQIGALARPAAIYITDALPKTRSGKIMRRLLRGIAQGDANWGDTSTLENAQVLANLQDDLS